jgi:hypothetical protein
LELTYPGFLARVVAGNFRKVCVGFELVPCLIVRLGVCEIFRLDEHTLFGRGRDHEVAGFVLVVTFVEDLLKQLKLISLIDSYLNLAVQTFAVILQVYLSLIHHRISYPKCPTCFVPKVFFKVLLIFKWT